MDHSRKEKHRSYSRQESQQDLVLGGDLPISSIQATIAKLSVRPPSATDPCMDSGPEEQPLSPPLPLNYQDGSPSPDLTPPLCTPTMSPTKAPATPPPNDNGLESPEPEPCVSPPPAEAPAPPAPSSLELLASLAPEAFSMEGGGKGKQRVTKQSFLQPAEGQGLHGTRAKEEGDPLSSLDPLWSLNKP